jgi:hypothetical protein
MTPKITRTKVELAKPNIEILKSLNKEIILD